MNSIRQSVIRHEVKEARFAFHAYLRCRAAGWLDRAKRAKEVARKHMKSARSIKFPAHPKDSR